MGAGRNYIYKLLNKNTKKVLKEGSAKEIAEYLKVDVSAIYNAIVRGNIINNKYICIQEPFTHEFEIIQDGKIIKKGSVEEIARYFGYFENQIYKFAKHKTPVALKRGNPAIIRKVS